MKTDEERAIEAAIRESNRKEREQKQKEKLERLAAEAEQMAAQAAEQAIQQQGEAQENGQTQQTTEGGDAIPEDQVSYSSLFVLFCYLCFMFFSNFCFHHGLLNVC